MTDRFCWHPDARLYDADGRELCPPPPDHPPFGPVIGASAEGLAQAIGLSCFRLGAMDQPGPQPAKEPVFETLTSGSTGSPRRILRTQASWMASFAVSSGMGIGPGARVAVLGQLVHSLALYAAIEALHLGCHLHLYDSLRPAAQARALARDRITHVYGTPAQLRLVVASGGTYPDLQRLLIGGAKLDAPLRQALASAAPSARIHEFYGASETSFITLASPDTPPGAVGQAYPGVAIRLDDDGEIWVRSPYLFLTYPCDPGHARWRDGWLSTGEVGRMAGGFLYLSGRKGRMVTIADQNVYPEAVETLLADQPGVDRAAVLPVPDGLRGHVLVAMAQGDRTHEAQIMAALRARLGPLKAPKAMIWLEEWPLLPSGKTDLVQLRDRLKWPG